MRTARFASALLLLGITLAALMAQKLLICDVDAADAAEREAALVQSLKRLQGSLAARNAQGGGSFTAYQARAARTAHAALRAPRKHAACAPRKPSAENTCRQHEGDDAAVPLTAAGLA
jgi:hypothetical protein